MQLCQRITECIMYMNSFVSNIFLLMLPSDHVMVAHFISFSFLKNYQPSTIASYVSAVSYFHKIKFSDDPTDSFCIKKMLKGAQNFKKII